MNMFPPPNAYAISKLIVETLSGLSPVRLVSLRFAQLVGLGEREGYMVSTFIRNALLRQPIIIFGKGQGKRDYLYVRDAACAIVHACNESGVSGIFNIGSGVATSPMELAQLAGETLSNNESEILFDPLRPDDPSVYQLDITRAGKYLGWSPAFSLREALVEMRREYDAGLVE